MKISDSVLLFLVSVFIDAVEPLAEFDNSILEKPSIQCLNGKMTMEVSTSKGQPSHVFAKGHFRKEDCSFSNTSNATFDFSKCDVARHREINPKGMMYSMTVIVQLHPLFTTKVDRAFHVNCFYQEAEKSVGAEFSVSDMPTEATLDGQMDLPTCTYTIHKGSPNGPIAKFATVGDALYHVWECPTSGLHQMYVHDCLVVSTDSPNMKVIDSQGCSTDVYIMPQVIYNENRTKAIVSSSAFNYPDQNRIQFNCQINLCTGMDGECEKPMCNGDASPNSDINEPIGNELARDELITTPSLPPVTATLQPATVSSTTTSAPKTTTVATTTTTASTTIVTTTVYDPTTKQTIIESTTITLPSDFPTPDPTFRLLKDVRNFTIGSRDEDVEGSGLEIARHEALTATTFATSSSSESSATTKREIRRRDAVDVDISSPELMIVERDFESGAIPIPQELSEKKNLSDTVQAVCVPMYTVQILGGVLLLTVVISITAVCFTIKRRPRFQYLP